MPAKSVTDKSPTLPSPAPQQRYLTRRGVVKRANEKHGVPATKSTIDKSRMRGGPPIPDAYYGTTELFLEQTADDWTLNDLCGDKPFKLGTG